MNKICKNCGKEKSNHVKIRGDEYWCHDMYNFTPSGRVSVPMEFIEAVRGMVQVINDPKSKFAALCDAVEKVTAMLDQMEEGKA